MIDGGIYDNPDINIKTALTAALEDITVDDSDKVLVPVDFDKLMENVEAAERIGILEESTDDIIKELTDCAEAYRTPPYGKETASTPEVLKNAAWYLGNAMDSLSRMRQRYMDGLNVQLSKI